MKRILALLLAVLLLFGAAVPAFAAKEKAGFIYPSVFIRGKVNEIYNNLGTENEVEISNSSRVVPAQVDDLESYVKQQAKVLLPKFMKALVTGDYDDWAADISDVLVPIYSDFVLDKNGNPREGSGIKTQPMKNLAALDGTFPVYDYEEADVHLRECFFEFEWDWRRSPLDVADDLRTYIDAVLELTGAKKVNLISRCEGCCVAMAYIYKYMKDKKLASNVFLNSSANGVAYCSNIFAGKFSLDADSLNRYIAHNFATGEDKSFGDDLFVDSVVDAYLRETLCMIAATHSTDWIADKLVRLVKKVAPMIYPGLLMSSYGTCPSYWAMVRHDDYEDAKKLAGLNDNPEWANFVKKIDAYHYEVQQRSDVILKKLKKLGVNTAILCKYGSETFPFIQDSDEPNDNTTLLKDASYGATTAKIAQPFSDAYIRQQTAAGKGAFLAPDRLVDASTCLFPETTWFVKYQNHDDWTNITLDIYAEFIRTGGKLTVGDNAGFARFYILDQNKVPQVMTEENANSRSDYYQSDLRGVFAAWLTARRALLRHLPALIKTMLHEKAAASPLARLAAQTQR